MVAEKMPDPRRRKLAYQLLNGFMEAEAEPKQLSREEWSGYISTASICVLVEIWILRIKIWRQLFPHMSS